MRVLAQPKKLSQCLASLRSRIDGGAETPMLNGFAERYRLSMTEAALMRDRLKPKDVACSRGFLRMTTVGGSGYRFTCPLPRIWTRDRVRLHTASPWLREIAA